MQSALSTKRLQTFQLELRAGKRQIAPGQGVATGETFGAPAWGEGQEVAQEAEGQSPRMGFLRGLRPRFMDGGPHGEIFSVMGSRQRASTTL